jgi:glycosyltransferase involved in cell wall biosynthesis
VLRLIPAAGADTIKLLHVLPSIDPAEGGPTEAVRQMGRELQGLGHVIEVLTLDDPSASFIEGYGLKVHSSGPSRGVYGYSANLVPWLRRHGGGYDAVVVHGIWRYHAFGTWRALRGAQTPYYIYPHGMLDPWFKATYPLKHLKKWLYWPWADYRVLRDARAVLFTCEEERSLSRRSFWLYRARERVVAFGTSTPPADNGRLREGFLNKYPELRGRRLLLFLGRIHVKKGCDLLLRAFAEVAERDPTLHLVLAGPDPTLWVPELKVLAAGLGIGARISWPGLLRDDMKWGAFYAAEAFVLPSHQENFGIAVAEALGCGLPVLISDKINIWREIAAAQAGLVDADTEAGARNVLQRWLGMDAAARRHMSRNARDLFDRQFTVTAMAQGLIDAIDASATSPS